MEQEHQDKIETKSSALIGSENKTFPDKSVNILQ